ncbi:hypothetical protein D6D10_02855 [Aureobasidium pullulans]|uniref:BTB domain-containing protein n=1 Tax=Aureobasidium pullulans TaxID=5580 RepID=A0A4V4J8U2_AURPU|nr:hypothetical protein D6D10_02855 [Aureobasidium pullulans]
MAPTTPKTPKKATPAKKLATPTTPGSPSPRIRKSQREAPDLGTELTFILLGDGPKASRKTFVVHKNLLMTVSGFFAMGLTSSFKEADTGIFEMEEEDPDVFSIFVHWIYFNRLFTVKTSPSSATDEDSEEWDCLPRLYTLGERLDAPRFKDAVISATIEKVKESQVMPDNWATYVYQNTVAPCGMRRLIVDFHVFAHQGKLLKKGACPDADEPEGDFLQDAMARMVDAGHSVFTTAAQMPWTNPCDYHEHGDSVCHLNEDEASNSPGSQNPLTRSAIRRGVAATRSRRTENIPPGALEMDEAFMTYDPRPLGVKVPLDSSRNAWTWRQYLHMEEPWFNWENGWHVRRLNLWRLRIVREETARSDGGT